MRQGEDARTATPAPDCQTEFLAPPASDRCPPPLRSDADRPLCRSRTYLLRTFPEPRSRYTRPVRSQESWTGESAPAERIAAIRLRFAAPYRAAGSYAPACVHTENPSAEFG